MLFDSRQQIPYNSVSWSWVRESYSGNVITLDSGGRSDSTYSNNNNNNYSNTLQQIFNIPRFLNSETFLINEEGTHFLNPQQSAQFSSKSPPHSTSNISTSVRAHCTSSSSPIFSSSQSSLSPVSSPSSSPSSSPIPESKLTELTSPSSELTTLVSALNFPLKCEPSFEENSGTQVCVKDENIKNCNNIFTTQDSCTHTSIAKTTVSMMSLIPHCNNADNDSIKNIDSNNNCSCCFNFNNFSDVISHNSKQTNLWSSYGQNKNNDLAFMEDIMNDDHLDLETFKDDHFNQMDDNTFRSLLGEMEPEAATDIFMDQLSSEGEDVYINNDSEEDSINTLHLPNPRHANGFYPYPDPIYLNGQSSHNVEVTEDRISSDIASNQIQSSPISNDSSSDWPGTFENKLPVFEEIEDIQAGTKESEKHTTRKRSTPSPRQKRKSTSSPNCNEKERKKPGRKPGQVSNVLHLWEFMRDLLHDPKISEGVIQWVSKADGVFRVVDSAEVARLWGQKKNNKKEMTYEKLSRSLRYSRLEGYFDSLPKDKNYPKKLCFKFGPKSRHFSSMKP